MHIHMLLILYEISHDVSLIFELYVFWHAKLFPTEGETDWLNKL